MRLVAGEGLVTSQGDLWKRQRRIVNPAFHRKSIEAMGEKMVAGGEALAESWRASSGGARDIAHDMMEVTLRIACRAFFSMDVESGGVDRIGRASAACLDPFVFHMTFPFPRPEYLPVPANFRFWRGRAVLVAEVERMVRERRALSDPPPDLLSMLLDAKDEETGHGMSDEQLRDELITMLMAGHETTANALAWTLHLLARNPDVQARAHEELDRVLGSGPLTVGHVDKLAYLDRVFSEGLRLYPPGWTFARSVREDDQLAGTQIQKGSVMVIPVWAIHRDPRWWPDPERFDPDRFANGEAGRPRFSYLPFSGGSRKCIGDRFAQMEAILVLAAVLRHCRVEPTDRAPLPLPATTLRSKGGIWLKATKRAVD
jgi:cytochrome P450